MRNDFLEHSKKGTTWKNHKYLRKEGKRYFYKENRLGYNIADDIVDTPDLEEQSAYLDQFEPIRKVREVLNTPIWSPDKNQETLISKGKDAIDKLLNKKQYAKR